MKSIKTILVVILVLVTVNTFTSCTDDTYEETLLLNEQAIEKGEIHDDEI